MEQNLQSGLQHAHYVQFSSLGSLDEKWMDEFASSVQAGSTFGKEKLGSGPVQIIWPTVEDIRSSIEVLTEHAMSSKLLKPFSLQSQILMQVLNV
jgi:hypothetical protein